MRNASYVNILLFDELWLVATTSKVKSHLNQRLLKKNVKNSSSNNVLTHLKSLFYFSSFNFKQFNQILHNNASNSIIYYVKFEFLLFSKFNLFKKNEKPLNMHIYSQISCNPYIHTHYNILLTSFLSLYSNFHYVIFYYLQNFHYIRY